MLRFMLILGLVLIFGSVGLLLIALQDPAESALGDVFAAVICQPDEELVRELGASTYDALDDRYERSLTVYCVAPSGRSTEVTLKFVLMAAGVFVVPFLLGLSMTMIASTRMVRRKANRMIGGMMSANVIQTSGQAPLNPKAAEILTRMLGANVVRSSTVDAQAESDGDLADKLAELEEAKRKELITEAEYYTMRQAILREFRE